MDEEWQGDGSEAAFRAEYVEMLLAHFYMSDLLFEGQRDTKYKFNK